MAKLFVSGIPKMYSRADVQELFARDEVGRPENVRMLPEVAQHQSRSAFVKYATREEGERAIEVLDGTAFQDTTERLGVKLAKEQEDSKRDLRDRARERVRERDHRSDVRDHRDRGGGKSGRDRGLPADRGGPSYVPPPPGPPHGYSAPSYPTYGGGAPPPPPPPPRERRVMSFTVKNDPDRRLSVTILDKVLRTCGQPEKILITPNNTAVATGFAMMKTEREARLVIDRLSCRHVFPNEQLLLTLELTDRSDVEVRCNNTMSWDYSRELPATEPAASASILSLEDFDDAAPGMYGKGGGQRDTRDQRDRGGYGDQWGRGGYDDRDRGGYGDRDRGGYGDQRDRGYGDQRDRGYGDYGRDDEYASRPQSNNTPVVLISGLSRTLVDGAALNCDHVEIVAGVYGDVMRVRILRPRNESNGLTSALVQYRRCEEAEIAIQQLNGCPLMGATLAVYPSDKQEIMLPRADDAKDESLFKSYEDSRQHRYGPRFPVARLFNARGPCNVLYISGLDPEMPTADVDAVFLPDGAVAVDRFHSKKGEAKVEYATVDAAFTALLRFHGKTTLGGSTCPQPLRIAFADRSVSGGPVVRPPKDAPSHGKGGGKGGGGKGGGGKGGKGGRDRGYGH